MNERTLQQEPRGLDHWAQGTYFCRHFWQSTDCERQGRESQSPTRLQRDAKTTRHCVIPVCGPIVPSIPWS